MPKLQAKSVEPLMPGARVALIAPAGTLSGKDDVRRAEKNAHELGWTPVVGKHATKRAHYFAGADAERLADLNGAIADDRIDAIWCLRGGYGSMRILPEVDFAVLARKRKPVIGFSDVTALLSAIQRKSGIICYHGPTARMTLTDFSSESLVRAVRKSGQPCGDAPGSRVIRKGTASGRLAGGNLSLLAAITGTPYAADMSDSILFLEDIDERTYRVDRMLWQLYLSGSLKTCRGIVFGQCTDCRESSASGSRTLDEVLAEIANLLEIPCIAGAPIGHIDDQWTIPIGARATLDTAARTLDVEAY